MDRRTFLITLALGALGAAAGCGHRPSGDANAGTGSGQRLPEGDTISAPPTARLSTPPPVRVPIPPGTLTSLPPGNTLALTVDDGADSEVVAAYIEFARTSGARFTFFVTAAYPTWTEHRDALRPLVDSGQIQLANHTWDHPDLTKLSSAGASEQLSRTRSFLRNTYGTEGTPFYRPPFGFHNPAVDAVAADLGYTTPTLWNGSLSDSQVITEDYLLQCARKYFTAQAVVIGHANHPPVTHLYPQLLDIIVERRLAMVTLDDVFTTR
ncbi:polysaccharide deacetylase family protein [Rhodococcus sp. TAF43]|uniref:polysaccharide deacetylase family protein n=1 Tax=Rhodococcus sp. TAF43 TaxID=3237483 RepID=UPI003F9DCB5D